MRNTTQERELVESRYGQDYSKDEDKIILANADKMSYTEIAALLPGRTKAGVKAHARDLLGITKYRVHKKKKDFDYLNLKVLPEDADIESIWDALVEYQDECKKLSTHQDNVAVDFGDLKHPIILWFLADVHIGAISGKYREFRERLDMLSKMKYCYGITVGDLVDNYLPSWHPTGQFGVMCPPEVQKRLVDYVFSKIGHQVIAMVQGCHDESSHTADDFDYTKYLAHKIGCANLGFGGFVDIKFWGVKYRIHARHKYRYNSSFNYTHTVKRMREH